MITLAYDLLTVDADGGACVGTDPAHQEPHLWHYWIPALAVLKPDTFRLCSAQDATASGIPFLYPVELRWEFLEWFRHKPDQTLLGHIPPAVLDAARRSRAVLVLSFAHEARSLFHQSAQTEERPCLFDRLCRFMRLHDLPPTALWFLNGNLDGQQEFEQWYTLRFDGPAEVPFQVRWCELFSFIARHTLCLHERGEDLDLIWEAEPMGRSGFSQHRQTRLQRHPLNRPLDELYLSPARLEAELAGDKLRPFSFLCMNRMPRDHRRYVVTHLFRRGLLPRGLVSFRDDEPEDFRFEDPDLAQAWHELQDLLPLTIDRDLPLDFTSYSKDNFNTVKSGNAWPFRSSYFNYVTETCFFEDVRFVSEKVFKPILQCQPFVVIGSPNTLSYLESYGFKTFSSAFGESYDTQPDAGLRMERLFLTLDHLSHLRLPEARDILHDLSPTVVHNFYRLRSMKTPLEQVFEALQESLES